MRQYSCSRAYFSNSIFLCYLQLQSYTYRGFRKIEAQYSRHKAKAKSPCLFVRCASVEAWKERPCVAATKDVLFPIALWYLRRQPGALDGNNVTFRASLGMLWNFAFVAIQPLLFTCPRRHSYEGSVLQQFILQSSSQFHMSKLKMTAAWNRITFAARDWPMISSMETFDS